ncbi:hypothetical protein [Nocardiopsis synnemataformans]|uniref:hypothetical protein n=1 Tax=Nocardiopsis synnemataformans TaxID=61305 RepID=UPI003EBED85A
MIVHGTPVGDHHTWVRPQGPACPGCECCTAALCEIGKASFDRCEGETSPGAMEVVRGCPCSGPQAADSVAHLMERWREQVRAEWEKDPTAAERYQALLRERVIDQSGGSGVEMGRLLRALVEELWPVSAE